MKASTLDFEKWVIENYCHNPDFQDPHVSNGKVTGIDGSVVSLNTHFFYKIADRQFGPIPYASVPSRFKKGKFNLIYPK